MNFHLLLILMLQPPMSDVQIEVNLSTLRQHKKCLKTTRNVITHTPRFIWDDDQCLILSLSAFDGDRKRLLPSILGLTIYGRLNI